MRKVKGFRIEVRPKDLARRAKKANLDLGRAGLRNERETGEFLHEVVKSTAPAVLYGSFPDRHPKTAQLCPVVGTRFTLGLATLGEGPEDFLEKASREGNPEKMQCSRLALETALDNCIQFVLSLVKEEAAGETCELGPINRLTDADSLQAMTEEIDGAKIGVSLKDSHLSPPYTAAFSIGWLARTERTATESKGRRKGS